MAVRRFGRDWITWLAPLALVPAGAFAVHQLRYWLAFGRFSGAALERQGHAYLHSLVPWIVLSLAVVLGMFLRQLGRSFAGQRSLRRYTLSFLALWLICFASLMALYAAQESLEGMWALGHPTGLAGILGYGGWWSVPAALAVGLVLAAAFHGARWVLDQVAQRFAGATLRARRCKPAARIRLELPLPRLSPLAGGWSGRGPPR